MPYIFPKLLGDASTEAQAAFEGLIQDSTNDWADGGLGSDGIQTLVNDHFTGLVVRQSEWLDSCPYLHLLWPKDAPAIHAATLRALGSADLDRMDRWAHEELKLQLQARGECKLAVGETAAFLFAPESSGSQQDHDDGYG